MCRGHLCGRDKDRGLSRYFCLNVCTDLAGGIGISACDGVEVVNVGVGIGVVGVVVVVGGRCLIGWQR